MADQVPAAQDVLEEPEENLHAPAAAVDQRDDFSGQVQQIRDDQQEFALLRAVPAVAYAFAVRLAGDLDQPQPQGRELGVGEIARFGDGVANG